MSDIWNELAQDILGNKEEKKERKRKLHELLDKYENNIQALEDDVGWTELTICLPRDIWTRC